MWKFLRGGAVVIPGTTFIPESRVRDTSFQTTYLFTFGIVSTIVPTWLKLSKIVMVAKYLAVND